MTRSSGSVKQQRNNFRRETSEKFRGSFKIVKKRISHFLPLDPFYFSFSPSLLSLSFLISRSACTKEAFNFF